MKKYMVNIALISGIILSVSGCKNNIVSQENVESYQTKIADKINLDEIPSHIKTRCGELVQIDADVMIPDELQGEKVRGINLVKKELSADSVKSALENYSVTSFSDKQEFEAEDYKGDMVYTITYSNEQECYLSVTDSLENNDILYVNQDYPHYSAAFRLADDPDYNADKYSIEKEFNFATQKEAYSKLQDFFKEIQITIGKNYKIYCLESKTLNAEEQNYEIEKKNWTEADNAYYFTAYQENQGIPVYIPLYGIYNDAIDYNASVQAIYNKDGICFLQVGTMYDFEETEEEMKLTNLESIFENIRKKYDMLIMEDSITINSMKLFWMPQEKEQKARLVWILRGCQEENKNSVQLIYDAATGEELIGKSL